MRALLLPLLLGTVCARLGEWDCRGCTVLVHQTCMPYDIGEDCLPNKYSELVRDLKLYRRFYYLEDVLIEEFRCLEYGISVRYATRYDGVGMERDRFDLLYKGYFTRECDESWSFAPYKPE